MLTSLTVKNFAIIDNLNVDFSSGLTVLTGETGAGKSLIIDAIGLLFGDRASNEMVRYGEEKATIIGLFSDYSDEIIALLHEYDIEVNEHNLFEEDNLIVKREIYATGKSKCSINNNPVTLAQLEKIGKYIGDIHSQNDTLGLINPSNYMSFIANSKTVDLLKQYEDNYKQYSVYLKEYHDLLKQHDDDTAKLDFLKYQLKELKSACLDINEEVALKDELKELNHYETVYENVESIKKDYHDNDTMDNLYNTLKALDKLRSINSKFDELYQLFEESYYNIESVYEDNRLELKEFDSNRLDEINDRLGLYSELKRKYKKDVKEILDYEHDIEQTLYNVENYDAVLEDKKKLVDKAYEETKRIALALSSERKTIANDLTKEVISHLDDLMLKNVKFEISFVLSDKFLSDGLDIIDFMVSFNKGEPVKALSKVASGGEMSRFMLALKTVLGSKLPQQTKIFDEIDSGVSGSVAFSIATKMRQISETSQVLCITHLPQVASLAIHHFKISKKLENERTTTLIHELNEEERIQEIASMISNGEVTDASIALATEMLQEK